MLGWSEWKEELPGDRGPAGEQGTSVTDGLVLPGMIIMWFGLLEDLSSEWVVCDGLNGTPDLRDSFVYCYSDNPYRQLALHSSGGTKDSIVPTHVHTVTNAGHFHTFPSKPAIWNFHDVIDYNLPDGPTGFFAEWTETSYYGYDGLGGRDLLVWPPGYCVPGTDTDIWTAIGVDNYPNPGDPGFIDTVAQHGLSANLWYGPYPYANVRPPVSGDPDPDLFPPFNPLAGEYVNRTLSNVTINATGVDAAGTNIPPYMVLYYIMYIGEV